MSKLKFVDETGPYLGDHDDQLPVAQPGRTWNVGGTAHQHYEPIDQTTGNGIQIMRSERGAKGPAQEHAGIQIPENPPDLSGWHKPEAPTKIWGSRPS